MIVPALNESRSIAAIVHGIREVLHGVQHEVLVVDDGSQDDTGALAEAAGARVVRHPYNKGYGAALKTGIREARHELCAMIDADGQHHPEDLRRLLTKLGGADMIVGMRTGPGYSAVRGFGNVVLNHVSSYLVGQRIPDLTSGLRVFRRKVLAQYGAILPNRFSFSTTSSMALLTDGYSVLFEPITVEARAPGSTSTLRPWRDGAKFMGLIVRVIHLFNPLKVYIPLGLFLFVSGVLQSIRTMIKSNEFSAGGIFLLLSGLLVVLMGFQIDQVSSLRRGLGRHEI